MTAVYRHELHGYFTTPVGYVFLALYTLLAGVVYVFVNIGQEMSASMNLTLSGMQLPLMLIAPLLTMRLFAEEKRMRTDQLLFTSPLSIGAIVAGKLLAAVTMLGVAMGLLALYPCLIARWAQISAQQVAVVFLGYFLLDTAMLSVGVLISSLCTNQITAATLTLGINLIMYLCEHYALPQLSASYLAPLRGLLSALPSSARLSDFADGIISLSDVTYFVVFTLTMAFLTARILKQKRFAKG